MKKVLFSVLCFMAMMAFASSALAAHNQQYTEWRGVDGGNWNIAGNWSAGLPVVLDTPGVLADPLFGKAGFKGWGGNGGRSPGIYAGTTVAVDQIVVGGNGTALGGYLNIDGGTLNISEFANIGNAAADVGVLTINSGTINTGVMVPAQGRFIVGLNGKGTLNINGGLLNLGVGGNLIVAQNATANGLVNLDSGAIYATDLLMAAGTARMVITDGLLVLQGNDTATIAPWLNAWITTTKAGGTVMAAFDSDSGTTTVWATPEPATVCLLGLGAMGLLRRNRK